jgi:hypothetical protein
MVLEVVIVIESLRCASILWNQISFYQADGIIPFKFGTLESLVLDAEQLDPCLELIYVEMHFKSLLMATM